MEIWSRESLRGERCSPWGTTRSKCCGQLVCNYQSYKIHKCKSPWSDLNVKNFLALLLFQLQFVWFYFLIVKVNSVQEASAKFFEVHISKFEIFQITWKKLNKEHQNLCFQFFINTASILMCFVLFFSCGLKDFKRVFSKPSGDPIVAPILCF